MLTTIEPRVFGSEAQYISRQKHRRDSCDSRHLSGGAETDIDIQRHSVIVNTNQLHDGSRDASPSPVSLSLLPCLPSSTSSLASFDTYLESSSQPSHARLSADISETKHQLKEEPEVTTKVEQMFLSSEFGVSASNGGSISSISSTSSSTPSIPNFLTFTPDESVTQSMLSGCNNKETGSAPSEILGLVEDSQT